MIDKDQMNILVVGQAAGEGSRAARSLVEARPHCRVAHAPSASEARRQLAESPFDMVLVDHDLAEMEDILSAPVPAERLGRPPRLVVGSRVTDKDQEEAHRLGAFKMVGEDEDGLEELCRTADRVWEIRRLRERQRLLLSYLGNKNVYGPCSTG